MAQRRPPSIRTLAAILVVAPTLLLAVALLSLSIATTRRIAEDLATNIVQASAERVSSDIQWYLGDAVRVSDLFDRRIRAGDLPTDPAAAFAAWHRPMFDELATTPNVASICLGNPAGDAVWLLRGPGRLELGRADGRANGNAVEFAATPDGTLADSPIREYTYDPRTRPWFEVAESSTLSRWTPIYFWFGEQGAESATGAGYTRAIRTASGELRAVLVVDVTLGALSDFLKRLPLAQSGHALIIDEHDLLVAASSGRVNTTDKARLALKDADTPAARAAHSALSSPRGPDSLRRVSIDGEPARLAVTPLNPYPGIEWRLVTIVPESSFMAEARVAGRRGMMLAGVMILAGIALAWMLSRRVAGPLEQLSAHVRRVGRGDFDARLELNAARELKHLSSDLNKMSGDLKEHMELEQSLAVAMEVQKTLLPASDPASGGMEIVGRARYCDQTGGDYYDFIDVSPDPRGAAFVAIGDVMGHGIGAALLMATARAALRARAVDTDSLGSLLTRVNRVLAADGRGRQFMTMLLMRIEPATGRIAWASAGHDPAIIYDPRSEVFEELEGGDFPLGVMTDTEYQDFEHFGGGGTLKWGSVVFIGTDGIWEAPSPSGELYGKDRLREFIKLNATRPLAEFADTLERELTDFRGGKPPHDDVTFVVVRLGK